MTQLQSPAPALAEALADAIDGVVGGFCADTDWDGEFMSLSRLWVAPPAWRQIEGYFAATFAFAVVTASGIELTRDDRRACSALMGAGDDRAILLWRREAAGSGITFAKFIGKQRPTLTQLAPLGFERNGYLGRSYHLPLAVDQTALARGDFDEAVRPVAAALYAARASTALFAPLVEWVRDELRK